MVEVQEGEIFLIQETHSSHEYETAWGEQWGGEIFFSHENLIVVE